MEEFSASYSSYSSSSLGSRSLREFRQQIRGRLVIRFPFQKQTGEDFLFDESRPFDRLLEFRRRRRNLRSVVFVKVVPGVDFRSNFRLRNGAKKQSLLEEREPTCSVRLFGAMSVFME